MSTSLAVLLIIAVIAIGLGVGLLAHLQEKKRRQALASVATRVDLAFRASRDHDLVDSLSFLNRTRAGSNRYAFNVLSGRASEEQVCIFDFHYATHSHDSKGRRKTHHHYLNFFLLSLPQDLSEVTIAREGFLSKVAQAIGYDDIDFESHEFSRAFCVRSPDKKLAYDVCNVRMIEYLLANRDLEVEIDQRTLSLVFAGKLDPQRVESNLQRLLRVRALLPTYLFAETPQ